MFLKAKGDVSSRGRRTNSAKRVVGARGLVGLRPVVPRASQLLDLSCGARPRTWAEALHEFYGTRHTAEIHIPWVMLGSLLIFLHSFTLFLRRRLLFGRVARPWTIAAAILFILLAAFTCLAAFGGYLGAFM
jgi:hypothetical protein